MSYTVEVDEMKLRKELRKNLKHTYMLARPPWRWWFTKKELKAIEAEIELGVQTAKLFNEYTAADETFVGEKPVEKEPEDEFPTLPWLE